MRKNLPRAVAPSTTKPWSSIAAVALLLAGLSVSGCSRASALTGQSTEQLVQRWVGLPAGSEVAPELWREVNARPHGEVATALAAVARSASAEQQLVAVELLVRMVFSIAKCDESVRASVREACLALMPGSGSQLRTAALVAFSFWMEEPSAQLPGAVLQAILDLMQATDGSSRTRTALSARLFGPAAAEAVPAMLARLRDGSEAKVRWAIALALGHIDVDGGIVRDALRWALGDVDAEVRVAAASGLMALSHLSSVEIEALLCLVEDPDEPVEVRTAAARALAEHAAEPDAAERTLRRLLELEPAFVADSTSEWLELLGKAAARSRGPSVAVARVRLEAALRADDMFLEIAAANALVRIGCATRDLDQARFGTVVLFDYLPMRSTRFSELMDWDFRAVAGLVQAARWSDLEVEAEPLRAWLRATGQTGPVWHREWAQRQLALLP